MARATTAGDIFLSTGVVPYVGWVRPSTHSAVLHIFALFAYMTILLAFVAMYQFLHIFCDHNSGISYENSTHK